MKKLTELPDAHLRVFDRPPPPEPSQVEDVFLIGICGTGMGSLAGLLKQAGYRVRGSDEAAYPPMSTRLAEMGIDVLEGFDPAHLEPAPDLVIVGNACTPRHPQATYARENHLPQLSFPEALAHFFIGARRSLVVAGTHGKTTTTGMLVHVLRSAGADPSFLVGGVMTNGNVNYHLGRGRHFVIEGDEYDSAYFDKRPKFMHYQPSSAIVSSMEFDHADIYENWEDYRGAFRSFADLVSEEGVLVLNGDDNEVRALRTCTGAGQTRYFGIQDNDDHVTAANIRREEGGQRFTLVVDGEAQVEIPLPMSGRHNLLNCLSVCAIALSEGITPAQIGDAFRTFRGMKRRQEILGEPGGVLVVDDFAHHPTAVSETIRAVADRWPLRRLVAVFEPRSNSSRRKVFEEEYARAFDHSNRVFLSTPRERHNDAADGLMSADTVAETITRRGVDADTFAGADELLAPLLDFLEEGDVALIMSNGSFDGLPQRLVEALEERKVNKQ